MFYGKMMKAYKKHIIFKARKKMTLLNQMRYPEPTQFQNNSTINFTLDILIRF